MLFSYSFWLVKSCMHCLLDLCADERQHSQLTESLTIHEKSISSVDTFVVICSMQWKRHLSFKISTVISSTKESLFYRAFVCPWTYLHKNYQSDLHDNFTRDACLDHEDAIKFWKSSWLGSDLGVVWRNFCRCCKIGMCWPVSYLSGGLWGQSALVRG